MRGYRLAVLLLLLSLNLQADQYETELNSIANTVIQSLEQQTSKTIAVLDFTDLQGQTSELGRFIAEELSTTFVISGNGLDVIDRANLSRILDENKLQRSGLDDPENIKLLGQVAGTSSLVIGTYTQLGESLRINAKVVSTATAKIVAAARGNIVLTSELSELMRTPIFEAGGNSNGTAMVSDSPFSATETQQRLKQETDSYTVTLVSSLFDKKSGLLKFQVEYRNLTDAKNCLAISKQDPVEALSYEGKSFPFVDVVGLEIFSEDASNTKSTSDANFSIVPAGASRRFSVSVMPGNINSNSRLDLTLNLIRGDRTTPYFYGPRCGGRWDQVGHLAIVFNNIVPRL